MSSWSTPKTNWVATDAISNTQLNTIGSNTAYLKEIMHISHAVSGDTSGNTVGSNTVGAGSTNPCQYLGCYVPDDYRLVVKRAQFYTYSSDWEFSITGDQLTGTLAWTPYTAAGVYSNTADLTPAHVLCTNTSGATVNSWLKLGFKNVSGGALNLRAGMAYYTQIALEAI